MPSNLTAFSYIADGSEATPGLFNRVFSTLSDNIATAASGQYSFGPRITVDSNSTDYLYFTDSSHQRSNYIIGSKAGGTADGLNIWDDSGQTMIVSFSKQSIRFYQNIVGPVFDVGGALADTLNAGTFGTGADSKESRIQAAISAATAQGISRVYVPSTMYPYSAGSISFSSRVQMIREGGDTNFYDVKAYGAYGDDSHDDTAAIQAAISIATYTGTLPVYLSATTYKVSKQFSVATGGGSQFSAALFLGGPNVQFIGAAEGQTVIRASDASTHLLVLGASAHQATIRNITFAGSATTGVAQGQAGIWTDSQVAPNDVLVEHSIFTGYQAGQGLVQCMVIDGLGAQNKGMRWRIQYNHFERPWGSISGTGYCILMTRAWYASIFENTFTGAVGRSRHGIYANVIRYCEIINNRMDSIYDGNIVIGDYAASDTTPGCISNLVMGNVFRNGGHDGSGVAGIGFYGLAQFNTARANVIDTFKGRSAIEVSPSPADGGGIPDRNIIGQNTIVNCDQFGINISGAQGTRIVGNNIEDCSKLNVGTYTAILVQASTTTITCDKTVVSGNVSRGTMIRSGFRIDPTALAPTNTRVVFNEFPDGVIAPMELNSVACYVEGNDVGNVNHINALNPMVAPTGSATTPSYAFSSETSLGWYRSAPQTIQQSTGTTSVFELWSTSGISAINSIGTFSRLSSSASVVATEVWSSGFSAIASIASLSYVSSSRSVIAAGLWGSGLSVGNATAGGTLIPAISSISSKVGAFVVQGSSSSFTIITWAAAQPGDLIFVTPVLVTGQVSSMSSGLVAHSHCTIAGKVEFRLSNCSTLVQNQSVSSWNFLRMSPF